MAKLRVGDHELYLTAAIGPSNGGPKQEFTTTGSVTVTFDLNLGSTISLVVKGGSPEAAYVDELASDIWLLGDVTARMRVWAVWQTWTENGDDQVSVQGVGYKRLVNRRLVGPGGLSFEDEDVGNIVWGLWDHTQQKTGGDLGVTLGDDYLTGIVRTRNYDEGENIGQLLESLSDSEAIYWDVDGDLKLTVRSLDAIPFLAQPLQLGVNVTSMQRASGGDQFANSVFGSASDETTPTWATDPDVSTDPRGLWEAAKSWPTVKLQDTLDEHVAGTLAGTVQPLAHWNVTMNAERWIADSRLMPGDHAVLVVPRSLAAPVGTPARLVPVQVQSTSVNWTQHGEFNVNLVVNERAVPLPGEGGE